MATTILQGSNWGLSSASRGKKPAAKVQLSDDEMRARIIANTTVLFPSVVEAGQSTPYEIVYGTKPAEKASSDESPRQYAMVVRRNRSGGYTPLVRGQAWSTEMPCSLVLQGLLDTTAVLIHKTVGQAEMPPLGVLESLPQYTPPATQQT